MNRRFRMARFRSLGAAERHSLIISLGSLAAIAALAVVYAPHKLGASARPVLDFFPPYVVVTGMTVFIGGSTYWGRLLPIGLGLIALAPILQRALPEWSPLLCGAAVTAALWWWAYAAWKYFQPTAGPQMP